MGGYRIDSAVRWVVAGQLQRQGLTNLRFNDAALPLQTRISLDTFEDALECSRFFKVLRSRGKHELERKAYLRKEYFEEEAIQL